MKTLIIHNGIIQPSFGKMSRDLIHMRLFRAGVLTSAGVPVPQSKAIIYERDFYCPSRIDVSKTEIKYIDADEWEGIRRASFFQKTRYKIKRNKMANAADYPDSYFSKLCDGLMSVAKDNT